MASLGIEVENGPGDGVQVVGKPDIQAAQRANDPKLLQVATSFALGDIILALDDRPTRDIAELLRVLGTLEPDQDITILLRRGQEEREFNFTLMEKP
jgi:S1-C subfamily serine protease